MKEELSFPFDFDVHFDVYVKQHLLIVDHIDRGFGARRTVLNDMEHDGTALQSQYFKSAALSLFNNDVLISYLSLTLLLRNR